MVDLDAHQKPPDLLRKVYKEYTRRDRKSCIDDDTQVVDFVAGLNIEQEKSFAETNLGVSKDDLFRSFESFCSAQSLNVDSLRFDNEAFGSREIDGMPTNNALGSMLIACRTRYHTQSHTIASATHSALTHIPS